MRPTPVAVSAGSPSRRRLSSAVTFVVAAALTVLSWPVGAIVAGSFGVAAALWCKHWPRPVRVAVLAVGTCVAVSSALVLVDFNSGTVTTLPR